MQKISKLFLNCGLLALVPFAAGAAGTYYTGGYQSPQQGYATNGYAQQQGYYNTARAGSSIPQQGAYNASTYSRYGQTTQATRVRQQQYVQPQQQKATTNNSAKKSGFYLDGGISRETAQWEFEMDKAGSKLHYDNVAWNVFDVNAAYYFGAGNTQMQVSAGLQYGMQGAESTMVDDDISNGGYFVTEWWDGKGTAETTDDTWIDDQIGHALSVGSSKGGSMLGYNVAFGLTDFFTLGKAKITPSIGYRSLSYKLDTKNNYGLSIDTLSQGCIIVDGEEQCEPVIVVYSYDADGNREQQLVIRNTAGEFEIAGYDYIDPGNTYYYHQPGTSHSYEVEWAGPYFAVDMVYDINQNNSVDAHIELGLPGYTATGDQPYRFDWMHPKSVEDKAGMGSALHLGLGANWRTALTDTVMLSIGLTYNYYSVSGADATTYLNGAYYNEIFDNIMTGGIIDGIDWGKGYATAADAIAGNKTAAGIAKLENDCPGWVCKSDGEIDSFYKSMGIRVGLSAKF